MLTGLLIYNDMAFLQSIVFLVFTLIVLVFFVAFLVACFVYSWYSYILLLMYITGMMVVFGYMSAMSPNFFTFTSSGSYLVVILFLFFMGSLGVKSNSGQYLDYLDVVEMMSFQNSSAYVLFVVVLLVALLMVVNLVYKAPNPLRPFVFS